MKMMRYIFEIIALTVLLWGGLVSCSPKEKTPAAIAEEAYGCLQDRDYKGFVDLIDMGSGEGMSENEKEAEKTMTIALLEEKYDESIAQRGEMEYYKVVSEEIDPEGMKALVQMEVKYGKDSLPTIEDVPLAMVDGQWLISQAK